MLARQTHRFNQFDVLPVMKTIVSICAKLQSRGKKQTWKSVAAKISGVVMTVRRMLVVSQVANKASIGVQAYRSSKTRVLMFASFGFVSGQYMVIQALGVLDIPD